MHRPVRGRILHLCHPEHSILHHHNLDKLCAHLSELQEDQGYGGEGCGGKGASQWGFVEVESGELVPGDLIDPVGEIMCDCIVVKGEIYVNEASLTG